jgi:tRNA nucleotidyltransferase (CCA-adding enzyme)
MKIYLVGGAVRDKLLGLPIKERDWVVVGGTVSEMIALGYHQVGKEFPVFLHPKTNEEYALARMERKIKPGYKGFTFDTSATVTLEADLIRRDLTVNAMAEGPDGKLIDPYEGKKDLEAKLLRHVSPAFAEDPVRILRVGRFLARYAHRGFEVAPKTIILMRQMVQAGEVDALVAERVWKELERALGEKNPEKFFTLLAECDALKILFPHLPENGKGMDALLAATKLTDNTIVRFSALLHDLPEPKKEMSALCHRYRTPNAYRELAMLTALHYQEALKARDLPPQALLQLFSAWDIFRREERFQLFLITCLAIAHARDKPFDSVWLGRCAQAVKEVDIKMLIATGLTGKELVHQIKEKRQAGLMDFLRRSS